MDATWSEKQGGTMQFLQLAKKRYSVRSYKRDPVEADKLQQLFEAACLAPTAANRQAFQLIVIRTEGREVGLRRVYDRPWFVQAPIVVCACGIPNEAWVRRDGKNYSDVDVAIILDHLILAATELGLGTCWIGAFDSAAAREVLGIPEQVNPIAFTPVGYPADQPATKKRKTIAELVRYGRW